MAEDHLIDTLVNAAVLSPTADDELALTAGFRDTIARRKSTIEADDPGPDDINRMLSTDEIGIMDIDEVPNVTLAVLLELDGHEVALSADELRRAVLLVDQLYRGVPRYNGSPESFFPIRGDQLKLCMALFPASIVYVWLEDCDPCDIVREDLEEIFAEPAEDIALFSVYGPEWSRFLHKTYDVKGGPVILFMLGDRVDTRFTGAYGTSAVRNEVETFSEIVQRKIPQ